MTGASQSEFQEKWTGLENLLFKYAALQDRQAIKKLLTHYGSTESKCAGRVAYFKLCNRYALCFGSFRSKDVLRNPTSEHLPWPWERTGLADHF